MSGRYLSCTTIVRDGNILDDWKVIYMPEDMNKFHLDDVYNSVSSNSVCLFIILCLFKFEYQVAVLMKQLPEGDVYLIENYVKMPNNINIAGANLFYVKLQTIAMLIALINNNQTVNYPNHTRKYFLIHTKIHA